MNKVHMYAVAGILFALAAALSINNANAQPSVAIGNATATSSNITAAPTTAPILNESVIAQNVSRANVTLMGTNSILNVDPVTFASTLQTIGEVFNNGTQNINSSNFVIPVTLYDENGTIVGTFSTIPELAVIDANNSSPFKVTFFDEDVKGGILSALFYKVQADNKSLFGTLPPPPPFVLGGGAALLPPGGVPFGFPPMGPLMGGPAIPFLGPAPTLPIPIPPPLTGNLTNQTRPANFTEPLPGNLTQTLNKTLPANLTLPEPVPELLANLTNLTTTETNTTELVLADICEEDPELDECTDFIIDQEALTSTDDENLTNTTSGQEQEETEEEQGQGESAASLLSGQEITGIQQEQPTEQSDQEGEENNEEDNAEEEES